MKKSSLLKNLVCLVLLVLTGCDSPAVQETVERAMVEPTPFKIGEAAGKWQIEFLDRSEVYIFEMRLHANDVYGTVIAKKSLVRNGHHGSVSGSYKGRDIKLYLFEYQLGPFTGVVNGDTMNGEVLLEPGGKPIQWQAKLVSQ